MSMSTTKSCLIAIGLGALLLALLSGPALAAAADGVDDAEVLQSAIWLTDPADPSQNAHWTSVNVQVREDAMAVECWLLDHPKEPDHSLEGFRIYSGDQIVHKYIMKPEWHPYHFVAFLNKERFPSGSKLVVLTNCANDGAYKQEFTVP